MVDADRIAREIVEPGEPTHRNVVAQFGEGILASDGTIDRARLAEIVFHDQEALARLNALTHPEVGRRIQARLEEVRAAETAGAEPAVVVMDVPLLVEIGGTAGVDFVVVVGTSEETQVRRLARDRGMGEEQARARIAAQAPLEEKAAVADWMVTNEGTIDELKGQIDALWKILDAKRRGEEPERSGPPPVL